MQGLHERDSQLRQLETNMVQINELVKDVAILVHDQGEIIESVDQHILQGEQNVETGNKQLKQAVDYQSSARRKKIGLIIALIIVIAIVALVLGLVFGNKK